MPACAVLSFSAFYHFGTPERVPVAPNVVVVVVVVGVGFLLPDFLIRKTFPFLKSIVIKLQLLIGDSISILLPCQIFKLCYLVSSKIPEIDM